MLVPANDEGVAAAVSVVIVLWNCDGFLGDCLDALEADPIALQVICVDNGSDDASADIAEERGCSVVRLTTNTGFPHAVNVALPLCRAPLTLLLNPDVRTEPGAIDQCVKVLENDASVAVVGANLRRPDGGADLPAARRFRSLQTIIVESVGLAALWPRLDLQYFPRWDRSTSRDVPCINGAFALVRTTFLRRIGGLDESAFLYLEDQELCRAAWSHGLRVHFVAGARALHVGGGPTAASSPARRAAAYLHRLDASIEIVARMQGRPARLAAIAVLWCRCAGRALAARVMRRRDLQLKYGAALEWLRQQPGGRVPPAPVP